MPTLRTIMTSDVANVAPTMTVRQAIDELRSCHVPSAPVQSHGRVVGIIAQDDLALLVRPHGDERETTIGSDASASDAVSALLEGVLVEDVMSPRVPALPPDADATAAVEMMRHLGDRQVVVMEGDRLYGIVYDGDLAEVRGPR